MLDHAGLHASSYVHAMARQAELTRYVTCVCGHLLHASWVARGHMCMRVKSLVARQLGCEGHMCMRVKSPARWVARGRVITYCMPTIVACEYM